VICGKDQSLRHPNAIGGASRMREKLRYFMMGRYGMDELGRFLNIAVLVILLFSMLLAPQAAILGFALLIYEYYRIFSRNRYKRSMENGAYLRLKQRFAGWISALRQRVSQRKYYRFYRCPGCRQALRVPKGKGRIEVSCPKCGMRFIKKS